jgi:hypothetical protein
VDLVIWDITEPAVSMVGACIPVLRVLVRDVRSTGRRYYTDEDDASRLPNPSWSSRKADELGTKYSPSLASRIREPDDDGSEKSILRIVTDGTPAPPVQRGHRILRTHQVAVESRPHGRGDVIGCNNGYELGAIRSR